MVQPLLGSRIIAELSKVRINSYQQQGGAQGLRAGGASMAVECPAVGARSTHRLGCHVVYVVRCLRGAIDGTAV